MFDYDMMNSVIGISKIGNGIIPANSAYGFEIINDVKFVVDGTMHYIIKHLVPGMRVFVRISARNQVGFGPRRETAPAFLGSVNSASRWSNVSVQRENATIFVDPLSNSAQGAHRSILLRWRITPHITFDRVGLIAYVWFLFNRRWICPRVC